jgi:ascorbate-specific PTS system EIIC-type component UlaA
MLKKSSITEALFYQTSNQLVYEAETNHDFIDCYPYAVRGIVFGLLLSTIFWGSVIGLLILVF